MSDRWLILGCGPSAELWWKRALLECDVTATCNDGILQIPTPDYYAVCEAPALAKFQRHYQQAKAAGTVLITIDRLTSAADRDFHEILPITGPQEWDVDTWEPGLWRHGQTTGSILVQYAANMGARELHLVGLDGYHRRDGPELVVQTEFYQGPLLARMAEVLPETKFIFYGRPNYPLADLPNVQCMEAN